jgi:hypothetical protein
MIPLIGISAELKDKRIKQILLRNGYVAAEIDMFFEVRNPKSEIQFQTLDDLYYGLKEKGNKSFFEKK